MLLAALVSLLTALGWLLAASGGSGLGTLSFTVVWGLGGCELAAAKPVVLQWFGTPRTGGNVGGRRVLQRLTESAFRRLEVALSSLGIYYYEVVRLGRETLASGFGVSVCTRLTWNFHVKCCF